MTFDGACAAVFLAVAPYDLGEITRVFVDERERPFVEDLEPLVPREKLPRGFVFADLDLEGVEL